jgi:hypothetical protein
MSKLQDALNEILDSSSGYLTASDLEGQSVSELRLAYWEIYARHGYYTDDAHSHSYPGVWPGAFNKLNP